MNNTSPSASAPSVSSAPPRNVLAAAISGAVSAVIVGLLRRYLGDAIPPELIAAVPVVVAALVAYVVPLTQQDVADRTNNQTVKMANADPDNPTMAKVIGEPEADQVAKADALAGVIHPELAKKVLA